VPHPIQKQRCAGEYPKRFLYRLVRHCGLAFFDRWAGMQQSGVLQMDLFVPLQGCAHSTTCALSHKLTNFVKLRL
jgi:hypothetical protein